jgi:hypothetical protein
MLHPAGLEHDPENACPGGNPGTGFFQRIMLEPGIERMA